MRYALAQKVRRPTVARTLVLTVSAILCLGYLTVNANAAPGEQDPFSAIAQLYTNPAAGDDSLDRVLAFATGFAPSISITMSQQSYAKGEAITVSELRLKNPNPAGAVIEVKIWLELAGQNPISILNVGSDGSFSFPQNFDLNVAPITLFRNDGTYSTGTYSLNARVFDPVTGLLYSEDLNPFILLP